MHVYKLQTWVHPLASDLKILSYGVLDYKLKERGIHMLGYP